MEITLNAICYISNEVEGKKDISWVDDISKIVLKEE